MAPIVRLAAADFAYIAMLERCRLLTGAAMIRRLARNEEAVSDRYRRLTVSKGFRVIYVVYLINKLLQGSSSRPDECDIQVEGRGQLPRAAS